MIHNLFLTSLLIEVSSRKESTWTQYIHVSRRQVNFILMLWFCNSSSVVHWASNKTSRALIMPSGPQTCEADHTGPSVSFCSWEHQMRTSGTQLGNLEHTTSSIFVTSIVQKFASLLPRKWLQQSCSAEALWGKRQKNRIWKATWHAEPFKAVSW